jgi:hypothetical protein
MVLAGDVAASWVAFPRCVHPLEEAKHTETLYLQQCSTSLLQASKCSLFFRRWHGTHARFPHLVDYSVNGYNGLLATTGLSALTYHFCHNDQQRQEPLKTRKSLSEKEIDHPAVVSDTRTQHRDVVIACHLPVLDCWCWPLWTNKNYMHIFNI